MASRTASKPAREEGSKWWWMRERYRAEREDKEAEVWVGGEEGVVEPVAEWVGGGALQGGGNGGVGGGRGEEGESRAVGICECGEGFGGGGRKDGSEGVDARACLGDGLPPGVHRVVGGRVLRGGDGGCG
ncbi:hypothetical protein Ahy_B03g062205 isoform E [Arachis hypogaea]|uniref:Uncharacterized protein n=1 Tax=Arachis hypogaea TaxID=3818 RepID=A0A444ZTF0_ARAHY|nr:hypothetical protein Ahy_B03g062205 isoform E [Arachis hypogaea]